MASTKSTKKAGLLESMALGGMAASFAVNFTVSFLKYEIQLGEGVIRPSCMDLAGICV